MRSRAARVCCTGKHGIHSFTWQHQMFGNALAAEAAQADATSAALPEDALQKQHCTTMCSSASAAGYAPDSKQPAVLMRPVSLGGQEHF